MQTILGMFRVFPVTEQQVQDCGLYVHNLKPCNFFWWGMSMDQMYTIIPLNKESDKEEHSGCSLQLHQQHFNTQ